MGAAESFDAQTSQTVSLLCVAAIVTGFLGALIGQTATFAAEEFGAGDRAQGDSSSYGASWCITHSLYYGIG